MLIDLRVKGRGKERDIYWLPSTCGSGTHSPGMCPDYELNSQFLGIWNDTPTN